MIYQSQMKQRAELARELCLETRHVGECFSCEALKIKLRELQLGAMKAIVAEEEYTFVGGVWQPRYDAALDGRPLP